MAELRGRVGSLLEVGTGFHPELSGRENIFLNGALLGLGEKIMNEKVGRILEFAELHKFAEMPLKYYSIGMKLRLAFSIATDIMPQILLIDEMFAKDSSVEYDYSGGGVRIKGIPASWAMLASSSIQGNK